jgi:hypothetical protein
VQRHAERSAVAERRDESLREMGGVDDDVAASGPGQRFDLPDDKRFAACLEQRLGRRIGQRAHPLAAARGEDHGADGRAGARVKRPRRARRPRSRR